MNDFPLYTDKKGLRWYRVAETRAGVYAWFRPAISSADARDDAAFKIAEMTLVPATGAAA